MSTSGIVYVTKNLVNDKIYVGIHTKNNPKYLGSGTYLGLAIKKYGRENFQRITIDEFDDLEVGVEKERYWITKLNAKWPAGYNLNDGGEGQFNPCDELRKRMSDGRRGKKRTKYNLTPEGRARLAAAVSARMKGRPGPMAGKRHTPETKAKMRLIKRELLKDPEERKKLGRHNIGRPSWNAGKKMPKEYCEKLSLAHIGHKPNEETRAKMRASHKKRWAIKKANQGSVPLSTSLD